MISCFSPLLHPYAANVNDKLWFLWLLIRSVNLFPAELPGCKLSHLQLNLSFCFLHFHSFSCPLPEHWPLCPSGDSFLSRFTDWLSRAVCPLIISGLSGGAEAQTWEVPAWRDSLSLRLSRCSLLTPSDLQRSSSRSSSEAGHRGQRSDRPQQQDGTKDLRMMKKLETNGVQTGAETTTVVMHWVKCRTLTWKQTDGRGTVDVQICIHDTEGRMIDDFNINISVWVLFWLYSHHHWDMGLKFDCLQQICT